jgi:hypothetical protein
MTNLLTIGESTAAALAFSTTKVKVDGEDRDIQTLVEIPGPGWRIVINYVHHLGVECVCSCGRIDG